MKRTTGIVYRVTNLINGKIYIGITVNPLEIRKKAHLKMMENNKGFYFHRSLKKHGIENFKWEKNNHLNFLFSFAYYDKTIMGIKELCLLFKNPIKKYSEHVLQRQLKKQFPKEYNALNKMLRSRQTSGEKNRRYKKHVKEETRNKIGNANRGHICPNRIFTNKNLNELVDQFFINMSTKYLSNFFNTSNTTIKKYFKILGLPLIHYNSNNKKQGWLSNHTKEEFYV